ncbi:hypothetical protein B0H67DRAFT_499303 [Lasiosphaeris hirsuta]|uniref:Uncharacterized protein n=1 Tax=Lasiosphaeris hirsuta TaxID=260670 RepID=A0AA40DJK4_9PEZI|nr:hypothetical protein B0H67DRAFT_499303 [Lasiosphaeris hirsuta]
MRTFLLLTTVLGLAFSLPTEPAAAPAPAPAAPQQVHLVFHAAPVQYDLTIPADGKFHTTKNGLNVNLIDAPDFNIDQCEFKTAGPATYVWQTTPSVYDWQISQYAVGPPQPIQGVTCHGRCLGVYSTCYENGTYLGSCCNGYCAANKCRPYRYF